MIETISKKLAPTGILRVGINMSNFLLINGKDSDGSPDGVSPDIGKKLARELNLKCKLVHFKKPGLLADAVNEDMWDIGNIACEKERSKTIDFTDPYVNIDANFMFRKKDNFKTNEDINLITLLVGAEESGLDVQNPEGDWIPIEAKSKSIVCNIGDMMQLVTRSQLKSTSHRVIDHNAGSSASRYSMPFFLHPSPEIELCSIVDDSSESISAHDFLEERLRAIKLY